MAAYGQNSLEFCPTHHPEGASPGASAPLLFFAFLVIFISLFVSSLLMKKKIASLKKKYASMTAVQQKFIRHVVIIKIAILILSTALFVLAWYVLMRK